MEDSSGILTHLILVIVAAVCGLAGGVSGLLLLLTSERSAVKRLVQWLR